MNNVRFMEVCMLKCVCCSYRLLAYDHGLMSFVDVTFNTWPVVLITNPKNALFLVPGHEPTYRIKRSTYIRFYRCFILQFCASCFSAMVS